MDTRFKEKVTGNQTSAIKKTFEIGQLLEDIDTLTRGTCRSSISKVHAAMTGVMAAIASIKDPD